MMTAYSFGESTAEGPALRDVERWKDKIEVRLDNRQVFFLFFGSALVACLLFILGVIVGKRLESRGRAEAPALADPLALLDKVSSSPAAADAEQELTFPKALLGGATWKGRPALVAAPMKVASVSPAVAMPAPAPKPATPPVTMAPVAAAKPATAPAASAVAVRPTAVAANAPSAASAKSATPVAGASAPRPVVASQSPAAKPAPATAPKPAVSPSSASASKPATAPIKVASLQPVPLTKPQSAAAAPAAAAASAAGKRYTLQLSSFQDRAEAEAYAKRFGAEGAYIVTSEVPDKGTWYRVRIGTFASSQEALNAKASFEKKTSVIAYVAVR